MRSKSQLLEELKNYDLRGCTDEPVVSSSVQVCKNNKYKGCVYFYKCGGLRDKERVQITINLDSHNKRDADYESYELRQMCQQALHLSFISLSKHDFLTSIKKWVEALEATKSVEEATSVTMYEKLKVVQRCPYFKSLCVENITQTDINRFSQWALDKGSKNGVV